VTVIDVTVPLHAEAVSIWAAILFEGATDLFVGGDGLGSNRRGRYAPEVSAEFGAARRERSSQLPPTVKLTTLIGRVIAESEHHRHYGQAQNLALTLQTSYSQALDDVDVLLMPTTPMKACRLPTSGDITEIVNVAWSNLQNTAPFNVSGHPALSVPCGSTDGLPIGAMIVGRHFEDGLVLRIGNALEQLS
jgi:amidase